MTGYKMAELQFAADSLQNLVANLGTGKDKAHHSHVIFTPTTALELQAMYRSDWLSRQIVDVPVKDIMRPWRSWQAKPNEITAIEDAEKKHAIVSKVARAMRLGRLYGGCVLLIGADVANPEEPIRLERIGRGGLKYLTVLTREMITPGEIDLDPQSIGHGEPLYYDINSSYGNAVRVHPSRIIKFIGTERPDIEMNADGWGDSILESVRNIVIQALTATASVESLLHEASIDVVRINDLAAMLSTDAGTATLSKRFALASQLKSINNTLLLDKNDEWDRKTISFSQLPEVINTYYKLAAAAADIPATRMLSQSPKGMNSSGDSDLMNYYDRLDGERKDDLAPALAVLDEVVWRDALGGVPDEAYYEFGPLWQMTDAQKSEIAERKAKTTKTYIDAGILDEEALGEAVANQLIEDATYPGLEASIANVRSDLNDPPEDPDEEGDNPAADRGITGDGARNAAGLSLADQIAVAMDALKSPAGSEPGAPGLSG